MTSPSSVSATLRCLHALFFLRRLSQHHHINICYRMSLLILLPWCILCFNPKAGIVDAPAQPLPRRTLDTMDMVPNLKELILPCHSIERIINVSRLSEDSPP